MKRVLPWCHPARPRAAAASRASFAPGAQGPWHHVTRFYAVLRRIPGTMVYGLIVLVVLSAVAAAADELQAGVARETFTLPKRVPLAGYSRRKGRPSQGLHDPVGVRALVIRDGTTTAVLVSCDLLIVDERLFDAVRRRAIEGGLPPGARLLIAATHTHSGPGAYGARFLEKLSMGHFDPDVFEAVTEAIANTLLQAHRTLSPVRAAFQSSQTHGLLKNRVDAAGETDDELTVYAVYRPGEAQPMAVLVGFAAHPTTLGAWNRQLSADYPGVVEREVERRLPGSTCLFFAGAVGDQAPVKQGRGFESAEWLGTALADGVMELLGRVTAKPPQMLQGLEERLPLPAARVRVGPVVLPHWVGAALVDDDAHVTLVAMDDTVFLGVPCDLAASLGHRLKDAARAKRFHPFLIGFANDYIGYCVPESLYTQQAYESLMAFNGPKAGEMVVERLKSMLDQVATSHKPQATAGIEQ